MRVDEFVKHEMPTPETIKFFVKTCKETELDCYDYDLLLSAAAGHANVYEKAVNELLRMSHDFCRDDDEFYQNLSLVARGLAVLLLTEHCLIIKEARDSQNRVLTVSKN